MNGDDAPSTLHAKLLEKGGGVDSVSSGECVGIEECASDNTHHDDREAPAENLAAVSNGDSTNDASGTCDGLNCGDFGNYLVGGS